MIDLRTVVPLDITTVTDSVARTRRLIVDEDYLSFGLSAGLAMRVIENLGPSEVRVVNCVANPGIPIPAALSREREVIPNEDRITAAACSLMEGRRQDL